jgi:flagellar biosynthesis/type III secretory pathway chaperone
MDAEAFLQDPLNSSEFFTQTTKTNIGDVIESEAAGYNRLIEILKLERQILTKKQFDQFSEMLTLKQKTLNQLDIIGQFRVSLLNARKLPISRAGIEDLIRITTKKGGQDAALELIDSWGKIIEAVEESQALNEINARIAHRAQMTNHHVLNILRGMPADPGLYNPSGKGRDATGTASITSA